MYLLIGIIAFVIGADQLTKWLVVTHIPLGESVELIPGVFRFTYIRNEGAAFGMLANHRWIFMVLSTVAILALFVYLVMKRKESKWITVPLAMIVGGGIANMIDRFALKYVIDFLDFYPFPFWKWIFNVADAFVVVGAFILGFYLISLLIKELKKRSAAQAQAGNEQTESDPETEEDPVSDEPSEPASESDAEEHPDQADQP
ncbi:MAG: signal peptidase II [Clostridia bacterium]|nr:signal peptidase II [Clostridia bacterium]